MDKRQYLIEAIQANAFKYKEWLLSAFSITEKNYEKESEFNYPYQLIYKPDDSRVFFRDPNESDLGVIDDSNKDEPLYTFKDRITLKPFDLPNVPTTIETNLGNVIFNAIVLAYPFGNKIPFLTGKIKPGKVDSLVAERLTDYPADGVERDPSKIYIDEYLKYAKAVSSLAGLSQLCTSSGSVETMTIHPDVIKLRDELLKKHAGELNDPAILAKIETELCKLDREKIKGTDAEGFLISDKLFDVIRKRSFLLVGAETGFSDAKKGVEPITKSLEEGWDTAQMPAMVNNLRSGSYSRGGETALGGESVKYFYRIFQNATVSEVDCGSVDGVFWNITADNVQRFVGLHIVVDDRKPDDVIDPNITRLTEDKLKQSIGKVLNIRSPRGCYTPSPSFCARCVGDTVAINPTGLHITTSDVGSKFLSIFMGAMHGKALRTARLQINTSIT